MARRNDVTSLPIGSQIKLFRERRELSQNELVTLAQGELTKGGISRIETGDRYPTLMTLEYLSAHLGCTFVIEPSRTFIAELEVAKPPAKRKPRA